MHFRSGDTFVEPRDASPGELGICRKVHLSPHPDNTLGLVHGIWSYLWSAISPTEVWDQWVTTKSLHEATLG